MKNFWWPAGINFRQIGKNGHLPIFVYRFRMAIHTYPKIHTICFAIFFLVKQLDTRYIEMTILLNIHYTYNICYSIYCVLWSIWAKNYHPRGTHTVTYKSASWCLGLEFRIRGRIPAYYCTFSWKQIVGKFLLLLPWNLCCSSMQFRASAARFNMLLLLR